MSSLHGHVDLGHTVAGWTGTAIALIGFTAMGLAVVLASPAVAVCGGLVMVLSILVTWMLHVAGWGKPTGPRPAIEWSWRVRDLGARQGHPHCLGCRLAGRTGAPAAAIIPAARPAPQPAPQPSSR